MLMQTSTLLVETISTNNVTDMFPARQFTMDWLTKHAASRFNLHNEEYSISTFPRPFALVDDWGFGSSDILLSGASRIIFTNGLRDGWSAGGIQTSLSDDLIAINIGNGAHHSDLSYRDVHNINSHDNKSLKDLILARDEVLRILSEWLVDAEKQYDHESDNTHDENGNKENGNSHALNRVVVVLAIVISILLVILIMVVLRLFSSTSTNKNEINYELVYDMPSVVERQLPRYR